MNTPAQVIVSEPDSGPAVSAVGDVYRIRAHGKQTGGAYALVETVVQPGGGPPLHWHTREDETFYVLEGEVTFTVGEQTVVAKADTFLHAPRNLKHRFQNLGAHRARMLIHVIPSGFDEFLAEFAKPVESLGAAPVPFTPEEIQHLLEIAPNYGIHICQPGD